MKSNMLLLPSICESASQYFNHALFFYTYYFCLSDSVNYVSLALFLLNPNNGITTRVLPTKHFVRSETDLGSRVRNMPGRKQSVDHHQTHHSHTTQLHEWTEVLYFRCRRIDISSWFKAVVQDLHCKCQLQRGWNIIIPVLCERQVNILAPVVCSANSVCLHLFVIQLDVHMEHVSSHSAAALTASAILPVFICLQIHRCLLNGVCSSITPS